MLDKDNRIVPSAPFKGYQEIESLARKSVGKVSRIQIDMCDGHYVNSLSWPFTEYGKNFKTVQGDVYLPNWEDLEYTADLMVERPEQYIESCVEWGFDEIIIHFRSLNPENFLDISQKCQKYEMRLYLAIDKKTDFEQFLQFAKINRKQLTGFQVMGIENIGHQGQEFWEGSLSLVKSLKECFPEKTIMFDGGINEETFIEVAKAGVDIFCVGSYLTHSDYFADDLKFLQEQL